MNVIKKLWSGLGSMVDSDSPPVVALGLTILVCSIVLIAAGTIVGVVCLGYWLCSISAWLLLLFVPVVLFFLFWAGIEFDW